jgi:hypothetical protein
MNRMYGIRDLQFATFGNAYDANRFLERYDGDIVDIQYRCVASGTHIDEKWMIVYVERE